MSLQVLSSAFNGIYNCCCAWCVLHSVVCSVQHTSENKLMNMNLFQAHSAPSQPHFPLPPTQQSPALTSHPPPSLCWRSAIFTCKYPGSWVGSWRIPLESINYICMWFERNGGSVGAAEQELQVRRGTWLHSSVFKMLVCPQEGSFGGPIAEVFSWHISRIHLGRHSRDWSFKWNYLLPHDRINWLLKNVRNPHNDNYILN